MSDVPPEVEQAIDAWDGHSEPPDEVKTFAEDKDPSILPQKLQDYLTISQAGAPEPAAEIAQVDIPEFTDSGEGVA